MATVKFESVPVFQDDLKALSKKYKHLLADLDKFCKVLEKLPFDLIPGNPRISDLGAGVKTPIYKLKHFKSLDFQGKGSRSGFRIIYARIQEQEDDDKIIFIEIYHKKNQSNHDKDRILRYFEE